MTEETTRIAAILERIFADEEEGGLQKEELTYLVAHQSNCLPLLRTAAQEEIVEALEEGEYFYSHKLYTCLLFLAFFEDEWAFAWIKKLLFLDLESFDDLLGWDFATECLPYVLAAIVKEKWGELKEMIENPTISATIQVECVNALAILYTRGVIERPELISYLKFLLEKALAGVSYEEPFLEQLICICADIWPGECLEEIREAFGFYLVDIGYVTVDAVLEDYAKGLEECLEKHRESRNLDSFFERYLPLKRERSAALSEEGELERRASLSKKDATRTFAEAYIHKTERNDPCPCLSGKKYKKCCLNKLGSDRPPSCIPSSQISDEIFPEVIWGYEDVSSPSSEDKEAILAIWSIIKNDPEQGLQRSKHYLQRYPDLPILYFYHYLAYMRQKDSRKAVQAIKELYTKFPGYLIGQLFYLEYLLARGEKEKVAALLAGAFTLPQLQPKRQVFHNIEWGEFCYVLGWYCIEVKKIDFAKMYIHLLEELHFSSSSIERLKRKLYAAAFYLKEGQEKLLA